MRRANQSSIELLQKLMIFQNWSLAQLASMYKHFAKKDFSYHNIIYTEGERDDYLCVVLKGEVELVAVVDDPSEFRPSHTGDSKYLIQVKKQILPDKVIQKYVKGGYFGDEEGWQTLNKIATARVASFECTILMIAKRKIKQNAVYDQALMKDLICSADSRNIAFMLKKLEIQKFDCMIQEKRKFNVQKQALHSQ